MRIKRELWFGLSLMAIILAVTAVFMPWGNLSNGHLGLLMLSLVVVAIMLGFPTAFTLMGMGVIFAWFAYRSGNPDIAVRQTLDLMVQRTYAVTQVFEGSWFSRCTIGSSGEPVGPTWTCSDRSVIPFSADATRS